MQDFNFLPAEEQLGADLLLLPFLNVSGHPVFRRVSFSFLSADPSGFIFDVQSNTVMAQGGTFENMKEKVNVSSGMFNSPCAMGELPNAPSSSPLRDEICFCLGANCSSVKSKILFRLNRPGALKFDKETISYGF